MANTIPSEIITAAYDAMNVVSQELVGMIPAVSKNSMAERVSLMQSITAPVVGAKTATNIVPGHAYADPADESYEHVSIQLTKQKKTEFHWTGEEERSLLNSDGVLMDVNRQNIAQCLRTLVNEIEVDLASEYVNASRALDKRSTTPFSSADDLTDLSSVLQILDENGAPPMGRSVVLNEQSARQLQGKQPTLFNINEGGEMRRSFNPISLFGSTIRMSHAMQVHDQGTAQAATMLTSGAAAAGSTDITVDGNSRVDMKKGNLVTFADETPANTYLVGTAYGGADTTLTIAAPGLRNRIANDKRVTSTATDWTALMAFSMDALMLATRVPAVPDGGDLGTRTYIQDPRSGLVFEIAAFPQYRQRTYEIGIVWGVKTIKPEHMALLAY